MSQIAEPQLRTTRVQAAQHFQIKPLPAPAGAELALTYLAISTQFGRDLLATLTSMFNPLPAIALLPLALLWFGLGEGSLIFVIVHSVLWALALNTYSGSLSVSPTLRMARNELYTDRVFAGLITVAIIGLVVANLVFSTLERYTIRRWGMA